MRDLARASDIPTVFMVQRMTNFTFHNAARIVAFNNFEAIRAAVLFINCQLHVRFMPRRTPPLRAPDSRRAWSRSCCAGKDGPIEFSLLDSWPGNDSGPCPDSRDRGRGRRDRA